MNESRNSTLNFKIRKKYWINKKPAIDEQNRTIEKKAPHKCLYCSEKKCQKTFRKTISLNKMKRPFDTLPATLE